MVRLLLLHLNTTTDILALFGCNDTYTPPLAIIQNLIPTVQS